MSRPPVYDRTIASYDESAAELFERYDSVPGGVHFEPVEALFPDGGLALDVGAGTGRDARWLSERGFEIVAVEPAAGFRDRASAGSGISWIDDRLPSLDRLHRLDLRFDLIILNGVWQHVAPEDRRSAFRKLAALLRPGGVMAMSLRSGPAPAGRPMYQTSSGEIEAFAKADGLEVVRVEPSADHQEREDVSWKVTALRRRE